MVFKDNNIVPKNPNMILIVSISWLENWGNLYHLASGNFIHFANVRKC